MSQTTYDLDSAIKTMRTVIENAHIWAQDSWAVELYDPAEETKELDAQAAQALGEGHACGTAYCFAGFHAVRRGLVTTGAIDGDGAYALTNTEPPQGVYYSIGTMHPTDDEYYPEPWLGFPNGDEFYVSDLSRFKALDLSKPVFLVSIESWVSADLDLPEGSTMYESTNSLLDLFINMVLDAGGEPVRREFHSQYTEGPLTTVVGAVLQRSQEARQVAQRIVPQLIESTKRVLQRHEGLTEVSRDRLDLDRIDDNLRTFLGQLESLVAQGLVQVPGPSPDQDALPLFERDTE